MYLLGLLYLNFSGLLMFLLLPRLFLFALVFDESLFCVDGSIKQVDERVGTLDLGNLGQLIFELVSLHWPEGLTISQHC